MSKRRIVKSASLWILAAAVCGCNQPTPPAPSPDLSLSPRLLAAVKSGKSEVALGLLYRGADPNASEEKNQSVLITAATIGDPFVVSALLQAGANPNAQNDGGLTALISATVTNKVDVARLLLKKGARTDIQNSDGLTALHLAAATGTDAIASLLVGAGAKVDERRAKDGVAPLHLAASTGHHDVVKTLLRAGASLDAKTTEGKTALDLALANGQTRTAELLKKTQTEGLVRALALTRDEALAADLTLFCAETSRVLVESLRDGRSQTTSVPSSAQTSIQAILAKHGEPDSIQAKTLTTKFSLDGDPIPAKYQVYRFGRLGMGVPVQNNPGKKVEYIFVSSLEAK